MAHFKTRRINKGYFRERCGKEKGKRKENFAQIMKDMGCGTFREVKELALDRVGWRWVVALNQS